MIKVMTLNLNYYIDKHGPWPVRKGMILETIREANPDILAFQAVRREPALYSGLDGAAQLAGELGGYPHVFFQPAFVEPAGAEMGSAIVSRLPLVETGNITLSLRPGHPDQVKRVMLSARFDLPSDQLRIFNAHFSWVGEQLADNLAEVLPFLNAASGPALIVGDFNAPAGEGLLARLTESGWVDGWETLHGPEGGLTFESGQPSIRIDYAWVNSRLAPCLKSIEVVGDRQGPSGEHISDHLGLAIGIDL